MRKEWFWCRKQLRAVTSLSTQVNSVTEGSNLIIQAHSTRDWKNHRTPVKFWTWQYDIDQNRLSLQELADVSRPEPILSEREEVNRIRREKWASMIHDLSYRNERTSKEPVGVAE